MAHLVSITLEIPVSVVPATGEDLPRPIRGKEGFVAKFNGGPPLSIPIGSEVAIDIFSVHARGNTTQEAIDNLGEAIETTARRARDGLSLDQPLSVGNNQPALVRFDLLQIG